MNKKSSTLLIATLLIAGAALAYVAMNMGAGGKTPTLSVSNRTQIAQVAAPTSGLVGYWAFDEGSGTTAADTSGSGDNGTLSGSALPAWTTGVIGSGALQFNGASSYVSLGTAAPLASLTYPYTVSLWFKTTANQQGIIASLPFTDPNSALAIGLANSTGGNNQFIYAGDSALPARWNVMKNLSDGAWHNVIVERDSADTAYLYVDGTSFARTSNDYFAPSGFMFGKKGSGTPYYFNGSLDDVRIYNRALSTSEVSSLYALGGGTTPPPSSGSISTSTTTTTATSGSGTSGPVISAVSASNVTASGATISWTTDTAASSQVLYGLTAGYGSNTAKDANLVTSHSQAISGLSASTQYHYTVVSVNASGVSSQSADAIFTTPAQTTQTQTTGPHTYNVKQDGTGDFTTIQACANAAQAGDTCLVWPGTYPEHVATAAGGTSETSRITFKANGLVTMRGFDIKHPYVTVDGFDITGYYVTNYVGMIDIYPNGNYAKVIGNSIHGNDGIHHVDAVRWESISGAGASYSTVSGNTISDLNYIAFYLNGSNNLISSNTISLMHQWDVFYIFGTGHVISKNVISNPGTVGSGNHPDYFQTFGGNGPAQNITIEGNWIQDLPEQLCQLNSSTNGVGDLVTNVGNFTIKDNVIVNVPANCNLDIPNTTWSHNTFYRMSYNMIGIIIGGSLTRGNGASTVFRDNVFLDGGSNPAGSNGTYGFYNVDGFLFTREVIAQYVTQEGIAACSSATGCPLATGIANDMISNGYIDGYYNGHILAAARALTSIDNMQLNSAYSAYKPALWTELQASINYDATMKSTFSADYDYVGGDPSAGFPAKKSSGCVAGASYTASNFCEPHGVNGGDPMLLDMNDPLGPDGVPFTADDGLQPVIGSPLCGHADDGGAIGAYACVNGTSAAPTGGTGASTSTSTSAQTPSTSGPVMKLDFSSPWGTSQTVTDASGNGNAAKCQNAFALNGTTFDQCASQSAGPKAGTYSASLSGSVCRLDSDYFAVQKSATIGSLPQGTISIWLDYDPATDSNFSAPNTLFTFQRALDGVNNGTAGTWMLGKNYMNYTQFSIQDPNKQSALPHDGYNDAIAVSFPDANLTTGTNPVTGSWHLYTIAWDGTNIYGYYDGQLIQTVSQAGLGPLSIGNYLALGALNHGDAQNALTNNCVNYYSTSLSYYGYPSGWQYVMPNAGFLVGKMADLRIYNRALSASEVAAIYSGTSSGAGTGTNTGTTAQNPDTTAPIVSISSPTSNSTVSGSTVAISVTANDPTVSGAITSGIATIQLKVDGTNMVNGLLTTSPYTGTWNTTGVSNGSHTLTAVAADGAGNVKTSAPVTVTVNNAVAIATPTPTPTPTPTTVASSGGSSNTVSSGGGSVSATGGGPSSGAAPAISSGGGGGGSAIGGGGSIGTGTFTPTVPQKPAPVCTASPSAVPASALSLTIGTRGQAVINLQTFLVISGYLEKQYITGYFGPLTKAALASYQSAHPASTCNLQPVTISGSQLPNFTRSLKLGMIGNDVKNLQIFLNQHNFTVSQSGPGSPGHETSYFGPATFRALIRFQNAYANQILAPYGLSQGTGFFGPSTMKEVNRLLK